MWENDLPRHDFLQMGFPEPSDKPAFFGKVLQQWMIGIFYALKYFKACPENEPPRLRKTCENCNLSFERADESIPSLRLIAR
jgi:hypothetical protein